MAIHSKNETVIREFAMKKPVSRVLVNTPSTHGAVGLSTNLAPSLTLGCGTMGGSSTSDNVDTLHLFNIRKLAYGLQEPPQESSLSNNADMDVQRLTDRVMEMLKAKIQQEN